MKRPIYAPCVCEVVIGEEGGCAADGVHCHCVHVASGAVWYVNVDPFTGIAVTYAADLHPVASDRDIVSLPELARLLR